MSGDSTEAKPDLDTSTRLAFGRTFLALERTMMAWVRTGLAAISFGFGIAKFFQYLHDQRGEAAPLLGGYTVGMVIIGIGLIGMVLANVQHRRALRTLRKESPDLPRSAAGTMAVLIMVLGVIAFFGALVRH